MVVVERWPCARTVVVAHRGSESVSSSCGGAMHVSYSGSVDTSSQRGGTSPTFSLSRTDFVFTSSRKGVLAHVIPHHIRALAFFAPSCALVDLVNEMVVS